MKNDPYDKRTVYPLRPRCVVLDGLEHGQIDYDFSDMTPHYMKNYEEEEAKNGTSETTL